MEQLTSLLSKKSGNLQPWVQGKIPDYRHYKRITVSEKEALTLARQGAAKIGAYFGEKLFFTQALIAGAVLSGDYDDFVIVTPSQYGKAIADDEPVLTKNGWKRHGELEVGDEVISMDGKFVKVIYVHPKCVMDRVITLESGEEVKCHHNHEWIVRDRYEGTRTISCKEMESRGLTLSDKHRRFVVPARRTIEGEEKDLPVHPYVLGAWLGDGSTTKGQICSCEKDIAVLDKCRLHYPDGAEWAHKTTGVITRGFTGLANDLSAFGMCYQKNTAPKHIPDEYLTASIDQRLELLAGLIDTDGYNYNDTRWGCKSRMTFTTAGEELKESFISLVSTFGWKVSVVRVEPTISSSGIEGKKPYWMISFSPGMDIPCVLDRKRPMGFSKQKGTGIVDIRPCEPVQGNCITVEGGTYRVGRRLIPTHNSWLMGMLALIRAYEGGKEYITAATGDGAGIIMNHCLAALQHASPEMRNALTMKKDQLERLATSLSKGKISFKDGVVEALTLGDTYQDNIARNKAVGRGGDFFVDEAANVSDDTFAEMGRSEFSSVDGSNGIQVKISNPHRPGAFYEELTQDDPPERTFILWMDVLTAVEEERWTVKKVLASKFARNRSTRRRYLLCVLDEEGDTMFPNPVSYTEDHHEYKQYFLGVDASFRGKDKTSVALVSVDEDAVTRVEAVTDIDIRGDEWIEGVTSKVIADRIAKIAFAFHVSLTCVDYGSGIWLVDALKDRHVNVKGINFGESPTRQRVRDGHYMAANAVSVRDEMHLDMQNLMEERMIAFHEDVLPYIKPVLPFVTAEVKPNGKIKVIKKSEIKAAIGRSPDELDAILLGIHAAVLFGASYSEYIT